MGNDRKAFVFVESPFQLLCAFEAINHFKIKADFFIRLNDNKINNTQLLNVIKELKLNNVYLVNTSNNLKKSYSLLKIFYLLKLKEYDYYILGDYFSKFIRTFLPIINKDKIILLDDGVATFEVQKELKNKNLPLNLYTIFDIKPFNSRQLIINNNFKVLKDLYSKKNKKHIDIFIGGKLVDVGFLSFKSYLNIINKCINGSEKLIYFPHRGASKEFLEKLSKIENLEIIFLDLPIELYLLKEGIVPNKIYSIVSTALFSLSKIYDDSQIIVYKPNFNNNKKQKAIDNIYNMMVNYKNFVVKTL